MNTKKVVFSTSNDFVNRLVTYFKVFYLKLCTYFNTSKLLIRIL